MLSASASVEVLRETSRAEIWARECARVGVAMLFPDFVARVPAGVERFAAARGLDTLGDYTRSDRHQAGIRARA